MKFKENARITTSETIQQLRLPENLTFFNNTFDIIVREAEKNTGIPKEILEEKLREMKADYSAESRLSYRQH